MNRLILKFSSLADVAFFTRSLQSGYIINTGQLTVTGLFSDEELQHVRQRYEVMVMASDVLVANGPGSSGAYTVKQ